MKLQRLRHAKSHAVSIFCVGLVLGLSGVVSAGAPAPAPTGAGSHKPEHQIANLGDFQFEGGEVLKDFKVSYVTHGNPSPTKDNVILAMDSFVGSHHALDVFIGPGKALDSDKFFIVAVDGLGNANLRQDITTGPTNSGLKMDFPHYTLRDAVNLEHELLTKHLGFDHILAVAGHSMGAMKALQFGVSHPGYVRGIIAISGSPVTAPRLRVILKNWMDIIKLDPAWQGGNYEANPTGGLITALMQYVPFLYGNQWFAGHVRTAEQYREFRKRFYRIWASSITQDARDIYYRWQSWADFNVGDTAGFHGDARAALSAIKAQVLLIGVKQDLLFLRDELVFASNTIPTATYVEIDSALGHVACAGFDPEATEIAGRKIAQFLSKVR